MFNKVILILMLSIILLGAAMIAIPIPVLWGMLCSIFIGLSAAEHGQQPR
jgi:hypothetical protein